MFYFGNLLGDGADPASPSAVRTTDVLRTRAALTRRAAGVASPFDYNKDGRVNALDLMVARRALFSSLPPIIPPATALASLAALPAPRRPADDLLG